MKKIYNIMLMISILTLALIASTSLLRKASAQTTTPAFNVSPAMIEMGPGIAFNQTFTVNLRLDNVDTTNAPAGILGVEVHLTWNTSLISPVNYVNTLGSDGSVFNGTDTSNLLYTYNGIYNDSLIKVAGPLFPNATHVEIALASIGSPWWGSGAIATVTFNVTQQPLPYATCSINYDFTDLEDAVVVAVNHDVDNGTVFITSTVPNSENVQVPWVTDQNYTVGIWTDSNLTAPTDLGFTNVTSIAPASIDFNVTTYDAYNGTCNVTIPNTLMWNASGTDNWVVNVDGVLAENSIATHDQTNEYIWFNFTSGTHMITIGAQNYVPEFTATSLMFVLMATMLVATAAATTLRKRRLLH